MNYLTERFWSRVRKTDTCWLWTGRRNTERYDPYGVFHVGGQKWKRAHRFSWELAFGAIPEGKLVCHRCDVRLCVRPDHLFLGTIQENIADRNRKGRQSKGERHGPAKLTEPEVLEIRRRYAAGGVFQRELAAEFGVSVQLVQHITSGRKWQYLLPTQPAILDVYTFQIDCE